MASLRAAAPALALAAALLTGCSTAAGSAPAKPAALPSASAAVAALPTCRPAELGLTVTPLRAAFPAGGFAVFKLVLSHRGDGLCKVDLSFRGGPATVRTAAGARVWSNGDCPARTEPEWHPLAARGTAPYQVYVLWNHDRSKPDCSPGAAPSVQAPPGRYTLTVTVAGSVVSAPAAFALSAS
ncbi:hypothetical protein [Streptacidiphilus rugosus]|uniref:hypothetical protein n=1 Tax=Streptacidiphilus rugosus TaxID=405783 RepID=UPI00056269B0|nr:hypothetical protein [Streptacidiphilus rugosus]